MALFATDLTSFEDLFEHEIMDLYDAEHRITEALPKMADAASSSELKQAFKSHLAETQGQVARLEQIFGMLGKDPKRTTCAAMKGLIAEGDEMIKANADPHVKDAALIGAAQRVEHYEMAGYGTARTFAERLGHAEAASLLQATLDEERNADKKLTAIAEQSVNTGALKS
jgi:ferritin-like metal-binding protein YciE